MPVTCPPRTAFAMLPTPLVRLARLEAALGGASVWMKRDDLTGLELSGNKVRKLEYVVAAAQTAGAHTLITEGTPQSNHCRAVAAVCARAGLHAHLLLRPPPPPGDPRGNHLLDTLFGATFESFERAEFESRREQIVRSAIEREGRAGRNARFTPMGASEPLGCWGYIHAAAELAEQLAARRIESCDLVAAVSSGGTLAGLLLGCALHRLDHVRVHAVPVSDDAAFHRAAVSALCRETIERFGLPVSINAARLSLLDGYVGVGYAVPTTPSLDALRLLARTESILLDPVYTAKAFQALIEGVRSGRFGRERPVVFLHTGGVFSNFAWPELFPETR